MEMQKFQTQVESLPKMLILCFIEFFKKCLDCFVAFSKFSAFFRALKYLLTQKKKHLVLQSTKKLNFKTSH